MEPSRLAVGPLNPFRGCMLYCNTSAKAQGHNSRVFSHILCLFAYCVICLPCLSDLKGRFKSSLSVRFTILVFSNGQRGHLATIEWIKIKTMEKTFSGSSQAEVLLPPRGFQRRIYEQTTGESHFT